MPNRSVNPNQEALSPLKFANFRDAVRCSTARSVVDRTAGDDDATVLAAQKGTMRVFSMEGTNNSLDLTISFLGPLLAIVRSEY
jgi:hypothetical protein